MNEQYEVPGSLDGFTAFGSKGANEILAFAQNGAISAVPFIPMAVPEAGTIAPSFTHLVRAFGRSARAI